MTDNKGCKSEHWRRMEIDSLGTWESAFANFSTQKQNVQDHWEPYFALQREHSMCFFMELVR